ncbi:hypothetical protein [Halocella sp. SP3-1]|uniref:hypothetical protein n=1 Tax=Halocella sp. SP3-1 TaxID=2382161 RepID=UPI000F74F276|nr:hypothetical protein [Halocella sp. SP3-1]AZO95790.1 hypothetical protein D7D81_15005 [Halocella sp. SP3-1]
MRKDNSDFVTAFVTDAGDFKDNRDYFAFVELDDFACWVLATGLDSADEQLSSELVVGNIISDFTERPSISRRVIKKYIKNANKLLINESKIVKLHASVLVVVSDYTSIVWGNVGNTRLYHLHKDKISVKSKDHSIAQIMLEAGDISQRQLNHHIERNNLTKYLGEKKRVKPFVSKKLKLSDSDVILACTPGFWENIDDQQIEDILKENSEPDEFVNSLEEDLVNMVESELANYTMVSFFAKKVFKESGEKKKLYKKVAIFLIPILILTGGYAVYRRVKTINARKAARILMKQRVTTTVEREKSGDELYNEGKYEEALAAYMSSKENYVELKKEEEAAETQEKIDRVETVIAGRKQEKEGMDYYKKGDYQLALDKLNEAKANYLRSNDYDIEDIEENIEMVSGLLKAVSYEEEGDLFFESKNYSIARGKYNSAIAIYRSYKMTDKINQLVKKAEQSQSLITVSSKLENAQRIETAADEFFKLNQFEKAVMNYIEAKVIYTELNNSEKISEIESKIDKANKTREELEAKNRLAKAEELEREGDQLFYLSEFGQADAKYREVKEIYSKMGLSDRLSQIEEKINKIGEIKEQKSIEAKVQQAVDLENKGDEALQNREYNNASERFLDAKGIYVQINMNEEAERIQNKINNISVSKNRDKVERYLQSGNIQLAEENYDEALFNYRQARKICQENSFTEKAEELNKIINNTSLAKYKKQASKYETTGDMLLEEQKFTEALFNYKQARNIYMENNIADGEEKINRKIDNTVVREKYYNAQKYESDAELQFANEKYDEALINYQKALDICTEIDKKDDIKRITEKIKLTEEKKKTIFDKIKDIF